jgi:hypothetical protein
MLAHMALLYFFVRLPAGTYETDLVTKVFDGMTFPFVIMLLLEDMSGIARGSLVKVLGFFWGMAAIIVSLGLLSNQPETWPHMAFTLAVTIFGVVSLLVKRKQPAE